MRIAKGLLLALGLALSSGCDRPLATCERDYEAGAYRQALVACQRAFDRRPSVRSLKRGVQAAGQLGDLAKVSALIALAPDRHDYGEVHYEGVRIAQRHNDVVAMARHTARAQAAFEAAGDEVGLIKTAIANHYLAWREPDMALALEHALDAQRRARAIGDEHLEQFALRSMFNVYQQTGSILLAEHTLERLETLLGEGDSDLHFSAAINRGLIEAEKGNFGVAATEFDKAITFSGPVKRTDRLRSLFLNAARANIELGRYDVARRYLEDAGMHLDTDGRRRYASHFFEGRLLLAEGKAEQAIAAFEAALSQDDLELIWQWQSEYFLGKAARAVGDPTLATASFRRSTETLDTLRRELPSARMQAHLFSRRRKPFEALFLQLAESGQALAALAVVERLNARTLQDGFIGQIQASDTVASAETFREKLSALEWAGHGAGLSDEQELKRRLAEYRGPPVVVHFVAQGQLWVGLLADGNVTLRPTLNGQGLDGLLARYRADRSSMSVLEALGEALVPQDVASRLQGDVVVVPDYATSIVALPSIVVNGQYLITHHTLRLSPSILETTRQPDTPDASRNAVVVLGNPTGDLPSAEVEAIGVARRLGVDAKLGAKARFDAVTSGPRHAVLHFATHSGLDHRGPWLRLHDGALTGADIVNQDIGAELVFLASCASAAPADRDIWGSLGGVFLGSGSDEVVAALWSIPDDSLSDIVSNFYEHYRENHDASASLAAAQRQAIERGIPAEHWSALTVMGDAEKM